MTEAWKAAWLGVAMFVVLGMVFYIGANLGYHKAMSDIVIMQEQMKREKALKEKEIELEKREKREQQK